MPGALPRLPGPIADVDPAWLSVPAGLAAAAGLLVGAPVPPDMAAMLAITVFCISLWIGGPVEPWFTGLIGVGLIGATFSTDLAMVGFRSPATWLVVMGILLGEATGESGLATLVERRALAFVPGEATDATAVYRSLLVTLSAAALAFVVLVPSSLVRVLILGPILISVGEVFDERRPRIGLFLGPLFVTYYGGTGILTGSLANIIITGLVEANAGVAIGWVEWAVLMGPVMAIGRAAVITLIAYLLYRPRSAEAIAPAARTVTDATSTARTRRMALYLLVGVAIWATDTLHGLHPLYGALVVALLSFAPRIGVVEPAAITEADFSIVFFLGAIFAIAEGLRRTAFTDLAADTILSYFPADGGLLVAMGFLVVASISLTFVMEGLAVASVLTPVLVSFSASANLPLVPVAMVEAVALNTYFFPYQSAVLVGILGLGFVDSRELIKMATVCSVATLVVLLPIQFAIFLAVF